MNVFAASHAIDDGADHDDEINEDAAHAHEALRGGVHGAGDEFSHTVLLEKSGRPFRRAAGITVYLLPSPAKSQGGFPERLACSDEIRSGCAMFPQEVQGPAGKGAGPVTRIPPRKKSESIRAPGSPPRSIMTGRRVGSSAAGPAAPPPQSPFRRSSPDSGLLPFLPLPAMMPHHPTGDVHGIPKQRHAGT